MGILEDWGLSIEELNAVLSERPSVRGILINNADLPRSPSRKYTPEQQQYLLATSVKLTWPLQLPFRHDPFSLLDEIVVSRRRRPSTRH